MILKHLCLSGMLDIIQSKITWFWGYILIPLLCSVVNFSQFWCYLVLHFFPILDRGLFSKLLEKALRCYAICSDLSELLHLQTLFTNILLAHLRQRLNACNKYTKGSEVEHCPSVCERFQTFLLRPIGQFSSKFIWRLLRMNEQKLVQMVLIIWPRWPSEPYMVKTFKIYSGTKRQMTLDFGM